MQQQDRRAGQRLCAAELARPSTNALDASQPCSALADRVHPQFANHTLIECNAWVTPTHRAWLLQYPHLIAFHKKVSELPNIEAYLPKRLEMVNANNLG